MNSQKGGGGGGGLYTIVKNVTWFYIIIWESRKLLLDQAVG